MSRQLEVAVVGVGVSAYSRSKAQRSLFRITLEACVEAIRDSGLDRTEIDGISGSTVAAHMVQMGLGIPEVSWHSNTAHPFSNQVASAVGAIAAGMCTTALVYNSHMLTPGRSRVAAQDPFRRRQDMGVGDLRAWRGTGHVEPEPNSLFGIAGYAAWANRYLDEYGATREDFGLVAVNNRSHAAGNENAVLRQPLTMADYLEARLVREPMGLYDLDLPVDGGDAFIVTTIERAEDLGRPYAVVHAGAMGQDVLGDEDTTVNFDRTGQPIAARALWSRSEIQLGDVDLALIYDGFTIITLSWLESLGWCRRGEAGDFLRTHWDVADNSVLIDGRVPMNTHGGSLSEGATSGSGHFREAVSQLRGTAGPRQLPVRTAVVTIGGLFFNPSAWILRSSQR